MIEVATKIGIAIALFVMIVVPLLDIAGII